MTVAVCFTAFTFYNFFLKKKFPVHDEKMVAEVGDIIEAVETKPISKTKRWNLIKVVEKGASQ